MLCMSKITVCGVVLAGGQSSRMGSPKELLDWKGRPLILHLVEQIVAIGLPCLIISNQPERLPLQELKELQALVAEDIVESHGPITGVHTAFSLREEEALLILSCDLPFVEQTDLRQLLQFQPSLQQADAVIAESDGRLHPMLALFHRRTHSHWQEALRQKNYKVMDVINQLNVTRIEEGVLSKWATFNMNTPDHYQFACEQRRIYHAFSEGDPDSRRGHS